jgi:two-component system LytT family response regulator
MADPIKTLIVDDERLARQRLKRLLAAAPDIVIAGEAANGAQAIASIAELQPDLLFLDIQLPELDGFEVLTALQERAPQRQQRPPIVIFTTAYSEYAVSAFDRHVLDYLLKPIAADRFARALDRARAALASRRDEALQPALADFLAEWQTKSRFVERLAVRDRGRVVVVRVEDVDWLESADNYVVLHVGARTHVVRHTMKMLETRLDPAKFLRIRRGVLVNVDRLVELRPQQHGEHTVVLRDGTTLASTRAYSQSVRDFLARLG